MNDISPLDPTIPGAVWRYKWLVAAVVLAGVALGGAYARFTDPVFTAKAELVVEDPGVISVFESAATSDTDRYVFDQVEIIDSPTVETRAESIVLAQLPDFDGDIGSMSSVEGNDDSSLIVIRVSSNDKETSTIVANAMVTAYEDIKELTAQESAAAALNELDSTLVAVDGDLASLQQRINDVRSESDARVTLDDQFSQAIDRIVQLQSELATASPIRAEEIRTELDTLNLQVRTYQDIQVAESSGPELSALIQELESTIQRRATLQQRRDQIAVDSQLAGRGIALASEARLPSGDGRETIRAGIIGGVVGTFLSIALAYSLAIRRRAFSSRGEPELIIDAPLISEVPRFSDEGITTSLPVQDVPHTRTAEAFRFAAAALDIRSASSGAKSLVAVSSNPGDGKTIAVANAAMASAREGNRVLVIDADFGSQTLSQLLVGKIPPAAGITEVVDTGTPLRRAIATVPVADGASLSLLARGHRPVIAANFFRSAATRVFFEGIRDEFDLILIDAPPLLHVAYTSVIARYADAALVVVNHAGAVSELEEAIDRLDFIGTKPIGYIYNRAPLRADQSDVEGSLKDILGATPPDGRSTHARGPNEGRVRKALNRPKTAERDQA